MPRQISPVALIDQQPGKRWTALVHVLECQHIHYTENSDEYKRLVLTDPQGMKLTALIFGNNLKYYTTTFQLYRRYYISNAVVIRNQQKYAVGPYQFSWILNNRTLVEELPDPIPPILPCKFDFTPFNKLHKYAESENYKDVKGIVVQCLPTYDQGPDQVTRRDIIIVNEEKLLLPITLWNQFNEYEGNMLASMIQTNPLIFGLRLKVTTFNSVSLTTKPRSGFLINPPVSEEELQIRHWFNNHRLEVQELLQARNFRNNGLLLPYPSDDDITSIIQAVRSFETTKTAWVTGKITLSVQERSFSYTGCANCQKALEADTTWIVICPSCGVESEIIAMSRMTVTIEDKTGTMEATMYTPEVDKFLPFTATQLQEAEENGESLHTAIEAAVQSLPITAFIRAYTTHYRGAAQTRVNIVKAYTPEEKPPVLTNPPATTEIPDATSATASPSQENQASTSEPMSLTTNKVIVSKMKDASPMKNPE